MNFSFNLGILLAFWWVSLPAFAADKKVIPVFANQITQQSLVDEIQALGNLVSIKSIRLESLTTEKVTAIYFQDGQIVKKGDVLIELDASEEMAKLQEEQSIVANAKLQIKRLSPLVKQNAVPQVELDQADLELKTAQTRMQAILAQINDRRIRAPFDGVLGLKQVEVGSVVKQGDLITTLDDLSSMYLDFTVPDLYLSKIKKGEKIVASSKSYDDLFWAGNIVAIDSRVDSITRSIKIRAVLNNKNQKLLPGMLLSVRIKKAPRMAKMVPEESVFSIKDKNYLYVIDAKKEVKKVEVSTGQQIDGMIEILDGVKENQFYITQGLQKVQDGTRVKIVALDDGKTPLKELLQQKNTNKAKNTKE